MTQYIDKDALVAEIEKRIKSVNSCPFRTAELGSEKLNEGQLNAYNVMLSFIDTLEVKEECKIGETEIYLNDDGGEPPYDGKQWLDLSCTEYEIPSDKFKDGDTVEMIIRKTQKGK